MKSRFKTTLGFTSRLMHNTKMLTKDLGTVLVGKEAVECGLIDGEGGIRDAIEKLNALIKND